LKCMGAQKSGEVMAMQQVKKGVMREETA
jgi:hypothetical protein